ncbi:sialate O-acetylesterase [uncultured Mesonia sp.]|uniref:sialate O-acetylesterase n=1 Tax=uncultured Mesonia sp. TaxID=399731 RepID=UPI00374FC93F
MKSHFCIIFLFAICLFTACSSNNDKPFYDENQKIFLVAGQSNAAGVGDKDISIFQPNKEVYEYDSVKDTIKILKDPVGQYHLNFQAAQTGSFIPALAYTYNEISNQKVCVVQAAKGGSSLTVEAEVNNWGNWSESGKLFSSSIYKTQKALQVLKQSNIHAIFWCQGENDAQAVYQNSITKKYYKKALIELINRYHNQFGEIPFVFIETGRFNGNNAKDEGYKKVREAQREVALEMEHVYIGYNETEFFPERGWLKDMVHYNQEALNDIGKKLAYFYTALED